jgi:hypothetical protein
MDTKRALPPRWRTCKDYCVAIKKGSLAPPGCTSLCSEYVALIHTTILRDPARSIEKIMVERHM